MDTFGQKLRVGKEAKGFSQAELACKINSHHSILGKYERDEVKPSIEIAKKIADALDVSLDYLVGDSDKVSFDKQTLKLIHDIEEL